MGSHYYYLVSQLPYLGFGQTPPMQSKAFKELAKSLLTKKDAALLDLVDLDPQPPNPEDDGLSYAEKTPSSGSDFIDKWREWERALRLNLARHRATKLGRKEADSLDPPGFPAEAVDAAARAVAVAGSPLEGENLLDRARWDAIESFQGSNYFSSNTVFAYMLKLFILERNILFKTETGFSEYKALYASILEGVQSGTSPAGEST